MDPAFLQCRLLCPHHVGQVPGFICMHGHLKFASLLGPKAAVPRKSTCSWHQGARRAWGTFRRLGFPVYLLWCLQPWGGGRSSPDLSETTRSAWNHHQICLEPPPNLHGTTTWSARNHLIYLEPPPNLPETTQSARNHPICLEPPPDLPRTTQSTLDHPI